MQKGVKQNKEKIFTAPKFLVKKQEHTLFKDLWQDKGWERDLP